MIVQQAPGDQSLLKAILRRSFVAFIEKVFETVDENATFSSNWHIEAIAHHLETSGSEGSGRLLITQPPRSLKSIATSIAYVAWRLGHDPSLTFICVSYSDKLASDLSRQFRMVVTSDWYQELFPSVRPEKDSELEYRTTKGGGRIATSVGGTLTGRGGHCIIIDDPLNASDSQSEKSRQKVINWYREVAVTRLNDKKTGSIIVVMQRLHEEDLAGYLLDTGEWIHLNLPAIAEEEQSIPIGMDRYYQHRKGELLQPEHEPKEVLDKLKADLGSMLFSAQYQQAPVPVDGNLIKRAWFKYYKGAIEPVPGDRVIQSWDIAMTTSDSSDYSVCVTILQRKNEYYVLDVFRDKLEIPAIKRKIISHARTHKTKVLLIEDAGPGKHLLQQFRQEYHQGVPKPIGIKPEGDKLSRMSAQTPKIEAGQLIFPNEAHWLPDFMKEVLAFPAARHDDQVDALSQILGWLDTNAAKPFRMPAGPILVQRDI